jgi:hypothetical protein
MKKHRLNLAVSQAVFQRIEKVREISDAASVGEVIRRALAVYDELVQTRAEGGQIILRDQSGQDTVLRIVW